VTGGGGVGGGRCLVAVTAVEAVVV